METFRIEILFEYGLSIDITTTNEHPEFLLIEPRSDSSNNSVKDFFLLHPPITLTINILFSKIEGESLRQSKV